jgi:hypothetical protein
MKDALMWSGDGKGMGISVKKVYNALLSTHFIPMKLEWQHNFWKWRLPLKVICFFWLASHSKILMWDILQQEGTTGPSTCF